MHEVDTHNHIKADDARFAEGVEKGEHPINSCLILYSLNLFRYHVLDNCRFGKSDLFQEDISEANAGVLPPVQSYYIKKEIPLSTATSVVRASPKTVK